MQMPSLMDLYRVTRPISLPTIRFESKAAAHFAFKALMGYATDEPALLGMKFTWPSEVQIVDTAMKDNVKSDYPTIKFGKTNWGAPDAIRGAYIPPELHQNDESQYDRSG
jgi:hypothetical protein